MDFLIALTANPYVPWDTSILSKGAKHISGQIGTAFNIGMGVLITIVGILIVIKIVKYFLD